MPAMAKKRNKQVKACQQVQMNETRWLLNVMTGTNTAHRDEKSAVSIIV